jgi:bifunctional ADP-heptose synthase (sugar kinase/adenylyltransferase)
MIPEVDRDRILALALQRAEERLTADRDVEVAARLLEAAAAIVAAQRGTQGNECEELRDAREAIERGNEQVSRLLDKIGDLRARLAGAGPCKREPT